MTGPKYGVNISDRVFSLCLRAWFPTEYGKFSTGNCLKEMPDTTVRDKLSPQKETLMKYPGEVSEATVTIRPCERSYSLIQLGLQPIQRTYIYSFGLEGFMKDINFNV